MTKIERVLNAIAHKEVDKPPKGEMWISPIIANKVLNENYPLDYQSFKRDVKIREKLGIDLVNVGEWPMENLGDNLYKDPYGTIFEDNGTSKHIKKPMIEDIEDAYNYKAPTATITGDLVKQYKDETDLFVFAQIGGPISMLNEGIPMEDYMVFCLTNTEEINYLGYEVLKYEIQKAKIFINNGADAILIADDMAFNSGTFLPPHIMDEMAFPIYKEMIKQIKAYKNIPVFLHTDGMIMSVMDRIVDCGFDGLQSLQPSAGMDIKTIKEKYGDKLCLWGNIDLDYILCFGSVDEVKENVRKTIDIANKNSGFILSSCNVLVDIIPPENVVAMCEEAEI